MVFSTLKIVSLSALFLAGCAVEPIPIWNKSDAKYRGSSLAPQQFLRTGEFLMSENCLFQFILEADGGLRLYKNIAGQRIKTWSADTSGSSAYRELWFQGDNNVVLYEYEGTEPYTSRKSIWSSGQDDDDVFPVTLVMQNDGNLVHYVDNLKGNSYKPDWHTGTWDENVNDAQACFQCANVVIQDMQVGEPIDQPENLNIFASFYDNCGNPEQQIKQVITHARTASTTERYSFTKSFSETFSNFVEGSVSISSSVGVVLEGFLSASKTTTASVTAGSSFSETRSSSSTEDLIYEEELFSSNELTISLTIPENKQVTHYVTELWGNAKVEWSGWGVCLDGNNVEVERKWISGMFHSSKYSRRVSTCDFCDNVYTPEDTGCLEPVAEGVVNDGARRLLESSSN